MAELANQLTLMHVEMLRGSAKAVMAGYQRLPTDAVHGIQALAGFSVAWMQNRNELVTCSPQHLQNGCLVQTWWFCGVPRRQQPLHPRRKHAQLVLFAFLDNIRRFQLVGGKLLDVDLRS